MSHAAIDRVADVARELGLEVKFCHSGVLVVIMPDQHAQKADQKSDQQNHVDDGSKGRSSGNGKIQSASVGSGAQGIFGEMEKGEIIKSSTARNPSL